MFAERGELERGAHLAVLNGLVPQRSVKVD
jgi:hypothetical protein